MTRSRKKISISVDPSNTEGKKIGSRIMRRKTKILLKKDPESELPKDKSEVIQDYTVCDYRFILWDSDCKDWRTGYASDRMVKIYKKGFRK